MMFGGSHSCMRGRNLALGVLASIYAIPVGWTLRRKWISLTMWWRVCSWWWRMGCVPLVLGMSGRLAITMSIPMGKLVTISSGVMRLVFVGSNVSHSCRDVVGSW